MLLIILLVVFLLALGGGSWGHSRYGYAGPRILATARNATRTARIDDARARIVRRRLPVFGVIFGGETAITRAYQPSS
jgi:hypothetical protein